MHSQTAVLCDKSRQRGHRTPGFKKQATGGQGHAQDTPKNPVIVFPFVSSFSDCCCCFRSEKPQGFKACLFTEKECTSLHNVAIGKLYLKSVQKTMNNCLELVSSDL